VTTDARANVRIQESCSRLSLNCNSNSPSPCRKCEEAHKKHRRNYTLGLKRTSNDRSFEEEDPRTPSDCSIIAKLFDSIQRQRMTNMTKKRPGLFARGGTIDSIEQSRGGVLI